MVASLTRSAPALFRLSRACLLVGIVAACDSDSPPVPDFEFPDSLAVESSEPRLRAGEWTLGTEPVIQVGSSSGEDVLDRVLSATRLSTGTLVVANGGSAEILYYSPAGDLIARAGGTGGGPGEFRAHTGLNAMWKLAGDTLGAWEHSLARMTVFDDLGEHVRTWTLSRDTVRVLQVVGRFEDGAWAVVFPVMEAAGLGDVVRPLELYVRYGPDGRISNDLGLLPGMEYFLRQRNGRRSPALRPLGKLPAAAVDGRAFYFSSGEDHEVAVFSEDGEPVRLIRWAGPALGLSREELDAFKAAQMDNAPESPGPRSAWRRAVDEAPYPSSLPAIRRMLIDEPGQLWVQEYQRPVAETLNWFVFDSAGHWVTTVPMDARFRASEIGADYVLGIHTDTLGVERVQLWPLAR